MERRQTKPASEFVFLSARAAAEFLDLPQEVLAALTFRDIAPAEITIGDVGYYRMRDLEKFSGQVDWYIAEDECALFTLIS